MSPGARQRPTWDEHFMDLARTTARRSEDPYVQVGAIVVRHDNSVASHGYNGPPPGVEIDWTDREARRPLVIHAEINALRYVQPGESRGIYVTLTPCPSCMATIAAHGIRDVYYQDIHDSFSLEVAKTFGLNLVHVTRSQKSQDADDINMSLLFLLADIRAAVGDPEGKLMQSELVQHCRNQTEALRKLLDTPDQKSI